MSNEVSIFNKAHSVDLSYLIGLEDETTKSIVGTIAQKRISIRGGVFRMMAGGDEIATTDDRHLNIVVIAASPYNNRNYYKGAYSEGVVATPDCSSDDGVKPNKNIENPQSKNCEACPMNIKGSGIGDSKACRYSRRLVVVLADNLDGDVYGLNIAASSLFGKGTDKNMPFVQYASMLYANKFPIRTVVTKMRFDTSAGTAMKLVFSVERPLTEQEYKIVVAKGDLPETKELISPTNATRASIPKVEFKTVAEVEEEPDSVPEPVVKKAKKETVQVKVSDLASIIAEFDEE